MTQTDGVLCGSLRTTTTPLPKDINICKEGDYIISLGIPIGNNFDEDAFWRNLYFQSKSCMAKWTALFRESVRGRSVISQAMMYSKFRYWAFSMLPSKEIDEYIHKDARELLWANDPEFHKGELGTSRLGKPPFISKEAASIPFGRGGIGALHWETHTKAMRAQWIFRYLDLFASYC